jgi:TolB-like protein
MNIANDRGFPPGSTAVDASVGGNIEPTADESPEGSPTKTRHGSGILHFIAELRRRRVCRAATMYAVTMWLICQVVEVIYPPLGLPDWTLKLVIVQGLLGLPVVLILSWMIEITPNGLIVDGTNRPLRVTKHEDEPRRPLDLAIDCGLLFAALIIGAQMAVGFLSAETMAAQTALQRIAVLPFHVASGRSAEPLSQGLVVELQRELADQAHVTVIASREKYAADNSVSLTGSVAVGDTHVRVTAIIINNHSGAVTWSRSFEQPRADAITAPVRLAQEIVGALPMPFPTSKAEGDGDAT